MYFAVSTVVTLMVPYQNLNPDSAVSDAFSQVGANWAKYFVSAGAGISMLCCTLVSLFPLPRILYSMSQDGLIPACFSKVNTRTESPIIATVVAGIFTGMRDNFPYHRFLLSLVKVFLSVVVHLQFTMPTFGNLI